MSSRARTQERTTETSSFGFRFFQLDSDLIEENQQGALAYPVFYNTEHRYWQPHKQPVSSRVRIFSPAVGTGANRYDIVACWFNPIGRRWEIIDDKQAVPFSNFSGETIPAYAVMQPTGVAIAGDSQRITVIKPNATGAPRYLVNRGVSAAPAGESGTGIMGSGYWLTDDTILARRRVLYDGSATPVAGQIWGAKAGQWSLNNEKTGFLIHGGHDSNLGHVIATQIGVAAAGMYLAKVPAGGIPARVGLNPGTTTADVWKLDGAGNLEDALLDQEIHNIYPVAVTFDAARPYFQINQDRFGQWFNEAPQEPAQQGVLFYNNSGETMPAGALIRVDDSDEFGGVTYIEGLKPNSDFYNHYLINGPTPVAPLGSSYGQYFENIPGTIYIADSESITPGGSNESWGAKPGSWGLHVDRPGFTPMASYTKTIDGYRTGYFKQREINLVYGKYYSQMSRGGSAMFEIWNRENNLRGPAGWNKIQIWDNWLEPGKVVKVGIGGTANFYSQVWESGITMCNPDTSGSENTPSSQNFTTANSQALDIANAAQTPNVALATAMGVSPVASF